MPRMYQRKTNRYTWSECDIEKAFAAIRNDKLGIRKAAAKYGIPYTTLQARISDNWRSSKKKLGRKYVFNETQETEIAHLILDLTEQTTPSSMDVRRLVYEYAVKHNVPHAFNRERKECGKEWLLSFLKRYPKIKIGRGEQIDESNTKKLNHKSLDMFYDKIELIIKDNKLEPYQIFNVGTIQIVGDSIKGAKIKISDCYQPVTSFFSVTICISGIGQYIPPMFIFKECVKQNLSGPIGAIYKASPTGLMCDELFLDWLQHFAKYSKCTPKNPVLLIIDNQSICANVFAVKYCREIGIELISIAISGTLKLFPLELSVFEPLQKCFQIDLNESQNLIQVFKHSYYKTATLGNAISGFLESGITPFNRLLIFDRIENTPGSSSNLETDNSHLVDEQTKNEIEQINFEEVFLPID